MPAKFSAEEILDIVCGRLAQGLLPEGVSEISTDTRHIGEGQWYLALSGEHFDGHNFLGDAFARGATGCIVAERPSYPIAASSFPLIAVPSTLDAYHALAKNWRKRISPLVIGITGSSGKTTTKEMCASIMSAGFATHKSKANENNEFGVPKTILSMPEDTEALVLEMAMRARGEIAVLSNTGLPDIGIIVNAGVAHLGPLASLDNIIAAKCELLESLDSDRAIAIIGQPTEALMNRVKQVFAGQTLAFHPEYIKEIAVTPETTQFTVESFSLPFEVKAHGLSHLQDAWCAIMAGRHAGLDDATIAGGLKNYEPVGGRGNRLKSSSGALVIDESYNANPDSVKASVSAFVDNRVFPQTKKVVVLGELAELGSQTNDLHQLLGKWLKEQKLTALITVGPVARHIAEGAQGAVFEVLPCKDQNEAEIALRPFLSDDSCVLIKGSRCANLNRLVSLLAAATADQGA